MKLKKIKKELYKNNYALRKNKLTDRLSKFLYKGIETGKEAVEKLLQEENYRWANWVLIIELSFQSRLEYASLAIKKAEEEDDTNSPPTEIQKSRKLLGIACCAAHRKNFDEYIERTSVNSIGRAVRFASDFIGQQAKKKSNCSSAGSYLKMLAAENKKKENRETRFWWEIIEKGLEL